MTTSTSTTPRGAGLIERWHEFIDVDSDTPRITIGEGGTPLVHAKRLGERLGVELHLKLELTNPTGSFKDRGMCVAVARAVQEGATTLICASTGNTSASAAAFAAAAGLKCVVVVPSGKIAAGKLLQAQVAGALVIQIDGSFDDGLVAVRELGKRPGMALVNSVNPYRIEGQKTGAWEVCEDLGMQAPDWLCIPVGNAGNITAYWRGFKEWYERGLIDRLPQLLGVQAAGAAPLVDGAPVEHPRRSPPRFESASPHAATRRCRRSTNLAGASSSAATSSCLPPTRRCRPRPGSSASRHRRSRWRG
jgi:threonine synthase